MPEFTQLKQDITSDDPVDQSTEAAFGRAVQAIQRAVETGQYEINELQKSIDSELECQSSLRQQNHVLETDLANLRRMLNESGSISTPNPHLEDEQCAFFLEKDLSLHEAPVHSIAISPDAKSPRLASASWDKTIKLYDLASKDVVRTLGGSQGKVQMGGLYSVAFAKTRPEVLGCTSCDGCVYLWDHMQGELLGTLDGAIGHGHKDEVNGIDFHEKQNVMITASDDTTAIIWDFGELFALRTLDQHTKAVYGAVFLGKTNEYCVATCCFDHRTRIFDMRDKKLIADLEHHTDDVIGIDYSPRDNILATGSDDGSIAIWDFRKKASWQLRQCIETTKIVPNNEVKRVAFSPDGDFLAAACSSGQVLVYDVRTGENLFDTHSKPYAQLQGHHDCVFDVAWGTCPHTGAKILVSASHDHHVRMWSEARTRTAVS